MDGFTAALADGRLAVFLPAALLLGALHALEPGHAKTMIASFIIATRGSPARALVLGISAAISHSIVVWVLVLTALSLGLAAVPEAWQPWLGVAAGLSALLLAAWMGWRQSRGHHHHHHGHAHAPAPGGDPGWLGTIGFGISGGLMPCPAALTVLLLCLNAGAVAVGALMVGAFSVGLAVVLVGVGVVASLASAAVMRRSGFFARLGARAPWLSVAIVAASGVYTLAHALGRLI